MEAIPRKRPGRPRKVLAVPNAVEEGADALDNNAGDGQVGGVGVAAQAIPVRPAQGWSDFVGRVIDLHNSTQWAVRHVYHPCPEQGIIPHDNGSIVVSRGEIKAILKDGKTVEI